MVIIHKRYDKPRGCGMRKGGGLYLVTDGPASGCGLFPLPLHACPACGQGIKPARGWTWVDVPALLSPEPDTCGEAHCGRCPLAMPQRLTHGKAGLLWIGKASYKTPQDWLREAVQMGISRRIAAVPRAFVLGHTWVLMAHRKALVTGNEAQPGIIAYFRPSRIEYVVKGDESEDELERLAKRGITLVEIVTEQPHLV